jgi:tetratricopeptide (TPR) repeat protein
MALQEKLHGKSEKNLDSHLSQLNDTAIKHYQNGQFESAYLIYEEILKIVPNNLLALKLMALLAFHLKKYDKSIELFSLALAIAPDSADTYNNRATAFHEIKKFKEALNDCDKAICLQPGYAEAFYNRGIVLKSLKNFNEAAKDFTQAIKYRSDYHSAYNNRGIIFFELGNLKAAIDDYNMAIALKANDQEIFNNRGIAFYELGQWEKALADFNTAISLKHNYGEAFNNRGNVFLELRRFKEALADYNKTISIWPDCSDAINNRGTVFQKLERYEDALRDFNQALKLNPSSNKVLNNRGNTFKRLGRYEESILDYNKALSFDINQAEVINNRGLSREQLSQHTEALADYDKAISIKPDYAEPYFNKSLQMLRLGNFAEGWPLYEWRWKTEQDIGKGLKTSKPLWQGEKNANVFLWAEQGIGDEIMFASLIPEVEDQCSTLTVKCDKRLIPLLKRSFSKKINFQFDQSKGSEDSYDFHIPIASLPSILRPSIDSFKQGAGAYLRCDNKKAEKLKRIISTDKAQTLIGISWNSSAKQPCAHHRNIDLYDLVKHLHAPDVKLVNLQYGDVADEIAQLRKDHGIEVIEVPDIDNHDDIDGLAALIMACDKVVSIDNATVHLAGALGAETKILLPFNNNWQWGTSGSSSYWYDSVELYRQQSANDWKQVLEQLKLNTRK